MWWRVDAGGSRDAESVIRWRSALTKDVQVIFALIGQMTRSVFRGWTIEPNLAAPAFNIPRKIRKNQEMDTEFGQMAHIHIDAETAVIETSSQPFIICNLQAGALQQWCSTCALLAFQSLNVRYRADGWSNLSAKHQQTRRYFLVGNDFGASL